MNAVFSSPQAIPNLLILLVGYHDVSLTLLTGIKHHRGAQNRNNQKLKMHVIKNSDSLGELAPLDRPLYHIISSIWFN